MRSTTLQIIKGAVQGDDTLDDKTKKKIIAAATGNQPRKTWLTSKQTASLMQRSVMTVTRYEKRGLLHPVRHSARSKRFDEAEVLNLINNGIVTEEAC
jgi:hypothetical protein